MYRFFVAFLISLIGVTSVVPLFAGSDSGHMDGGSVMMIGGGWDTCTAGIQCEKIDGVSSYVCEKIPASLNSSSGMLLQIVQVGLSQRCILIPMASILAQRGVQSRYESLILGYREPDRFLYPFVRITKIQV